MGVRKQDGHKNIILYILDPNDLTKTIEYHPNTEAKKVFLSATSKQTVADHINNKTDNQHVDSDARKLLNNKGKDRLLKLDKTGHIPLENTNPESIALYYEFRNIDALLTTNAFDPYKNYGRLVLVENTSGDRRNRFNGWGIYRFTGEYGNRDIRSYKLIFNDKTADKIIYWDDFTNIIKSTVREIDEMVNNSHTHKKDNREVLDNLSVDESGFLRYKGIRIVTREEFHTIIPTTDPELANVFNGDLGLYIDKIQEHIEISEEDIKHEDPIIVLEGNCDGKYKGNLKIVNGYKLKTNRVISMKEFYANCMNLEMIPWYDTNSVQDMSFFVYNCPKLKGIPPMDLSKATTLRGFAYNSGLEQFTDVIAPECIDASSMFRDSRNFKYINSIKMNKVRDLHHMFYNTDLRFISGEFTANLAIDLSYLFAKCKNLFRVNKMNTHKAANMSHMFEDCESLTYILNIDFSSCANTTAMFKGCSKLQYLNITPGSLKCSLDLSETSIDYHAFKNLLNALSSVDKECILNVSGTQCISEITQEDIDRAEMLNWVILY